ncbi:hypothetical protein Ctha_1045 [Chloroherpeton thalassium ATCC 35110]|uniref:YbbR family protein n=2 Tax=Chloroherpeton thalassium TaxID=100716 RepID=B3QXY1_CHLT3|nr:hypothetical protein Ctha_1045 [Chloroherpeton thalassium ATCC 35110]
MTKTYTTIKRVPVTVDYSESQFAVCSNLPKYVEVKFDGIGWKILSLYYSKTEWTVDLEQDFSENLIFIETNKNPQQYLTSLPDGLVPIEVLPSTLTIQLDEKITKTLPIKLRAKIEPAVGYTIVGNPKLTPDSVTVTGAKCVLKKMTCWETQREQYTKLDSKFQFSLELSDSLVQKVTLSAHRTRVTGLAEQLAELNFQDVPITVKQVPERASIALIPNRISVLVGGSISALANLKRDSVSVSVPYERILNDTTGAIVPDIQLPKFINLQDISPKELQYILRK